jgi:hypothetical protein
MSKKPTSGRIDCVFIRKSTTDPEQCPRRGLGDGRRALEAEVVQAETPVGGPRAAYRQEHAGPVLAAFADWLAAQRPRVLPKSLIGRPSHTPRTSGRPSASTSPTGGCGWRVPRGEVRRAGQKGPDGVLVRPRRAARAEFGGGAKERRHVRRAQAAAGRVAATLGGESRCNCSFG